LADPIVAPNILLRPVIQLQRITKRFPGVLALDKVNLEVMPGEIHGLLGENGAGKSTLMNILAGELQPDSGQIFYQGQARTIANAAISQQMGIAVVYQELALCHNLTIAQNIGMNRIARLSSLRWMPHRSANQIAKEQLARLGIGYLDPRTPVKQLTLAQQQLVDIAKALSTDAKLLILDEPNSALTIDETKTLFRILRQLRDQGVAIVYISHRLEEVLSLVDRITVMRDGRNVDTFAANGATVDRLISQMVGRAVENLYRREREAEPQDTPVLEVQGLSSGQAVRAVSFTVAKGEIVGFAGLPDAGREELVECLFGMRQIDQGHLRVSGKPVSLRSPAAAIAHGLALVPADRRGTGAILKMNVQNNIIAANTKTVSRFGILSRPAARQMAKEAIQQLDIRTAGPHQSMATLSGGNQQKVIFGRALATQPRVFLLHEPTRGIDVGAKAEIYSILNQLVAQGAGVLLVSSELPELMSQCDRILVMHGGTITGHFQRSEFSDEAILACAMGQAVH